MKFKIEYWNMQSDSEAAMGCADLPAAQMRAAILVAQGHRNPTIYMRHKAKWIRVQYE